ncbi:hypothetical protein Tco_0974461 [Tanacetum coccineum]|uniref:Uncharacterized protein n=1 Tax=Tanacetum coccineum TaxID=301880 RepID=A0ABQ5EBM7_9ASTR
MGDENPIRTLETTPNQAMRGYRIPFELPAGKNVTHLTLTVKIGKERASVYFNLHFAIKLAIGLNVLSTLTISNMGGSYYADSLLILPPGRTQNSSMSMPMFPTTSMEKSLI